MVKLTKSELPPHIKIESEKDYRSDEVLKILTEDCHGKCYICEIKPTTINVEHIRPHSKNPDLKFSWYNLFIACGHCNGIKSDKFEELIDPTKCDPEDYIALSVETTDDLIERVKIKPLASDDSTMQTAELLRLVYNDGSTATRRLECSALRNDHLLFHIRVFWQYINNYREEPDSGYDIIVVKEIDRSSAFAAFKREIVRSDPELSAKFFAKG